jgi:hypothetical protein
MISNVRSIIYVEVLGDISCSSARRRVVHSIYVILAISK